MFPHKLRTAGVLLGIVVVAGLTTDPANAQPKDQPPSYKATPPAEAKAGGPVKKTLTVIPLKNPALKPEKLATALSKIFASPTSGGPTITPLADENALLVYADEATMKTVEEILRLDGIARMFQTVVPLRKLDPNEAVRLVKNKLDADEAARLVKGYRSPPVPTVVAVPADKVLLIHADGESTAKILDALRAAGEDVKSAMLAFAAREPGYEISFQNASWDDVIDWYAKTSGLFLNSAVTPTGKVTITPGKDKTFTLAEITDLLNETLIQQKFLLIRRWASFTIVPADEKIDPTIVPRITLDELEKRGKTELVLVLMPLKDQNAEEIAPEVRKMLTPFGDVRVFKNTLYVQDTAGNARRIWETLHQVECWDGVPSKDKPMTPPTVPPNADKK